MFIILHERNPGTVFPLFIIQQIHYNTIYAEIMNVLTFVDSGYAADSASGATEHNGYEDVE